MAKDTYKIPPSLARSFLDHQIPLPLFGMTPRPTPIRQLLFYAAGIIVVLWASMSTFIKSSGPVPIALFVIWALAAVAYLGRLTRTKQLTVQSVPALVNYIPTGARRLVTRRSGDPSAFASVTGLQSVDDEGVLHFYGGAAARIYLVVGSASYMLFDEDRTAILDRVDAFWRKVPTGVQFTWLTTREPQRIYHQVASLERRNRALVSRDADLLALQDEQYSILVDHVGGQFMSIQQYLVVRGRNPDALHQGETALAAEVETSSLMIKEATRLSVEDTEAVLRDLYRGLDPVILPRPSQ